jgi:hypothetical protein
METCWDTIQNGLNMGEHVGKLSLNMFSFLFLQMERIANISLGFLKLRSPRSPYSPFDGLFSQTELHGDIHHLCACFV